MRSATLIPSNPFSRNSFDATSTILSRFAAASSLLTFMLLSFPLGMLLTRYMTYVISRQHNDDGHHLKSSKHPRRRRTADDLFDPCRRPAPARHPLWLGRRRRDISHDAGHRRRARRPRHPDGSAGEGIRLEH